MYLKNLFPPANIGQTHHYLTIESAWPKQGGVQYVRSVGRGDHNDTIIQFKTIHLHEELVQGLLTLIVTTTQASAAMATHCVDLIDEDNAGRLLFGLLEHVANAGRTDAHKHLNKIRA